MEDNIYVEISKKNIRKSICINGSDYDFSHIPMSLGKPIHQAQIKCVCCDKMYDTERLEQKYVGYLCKKCERNKKLERLNEA